MGPAVRCRAIVTATRATGGGLAAIVLVSALLAALLTGCGGKQPVDAGAQGAGATTSIASSGGDGAPAAPTTAAAAPDPEGSAAPSTDAPATEAPPATGPPSSGVPGQRDAFSVGWESYTVAADGRTLTFTYYSGVAPCSVFQSVAADESGSEVKVTIYERSEAGPDVSCVAMAEQKSASVTLRAELGDRSVVDGSR